MQVIECEQGTGVWLKARAGKITASRMSDVLAYTKKGEETARRADYRIELVAERLTGTATEKFVTFAMKEGIRLEPEARTEYELATDVMVDQVGFVLHPTLNAGASPDGLVGDLGLVEIKCPTRTTHVEYLLADQVPPEYEPQMMWQMACTGRQWCDFMSYCPDFPAPLNKFIKRLHRDDARILELELAVAKLDDEVEHTIQRLTEGR